MTGFVRAAGRAVAALSLAALCACTPASPTLTAGPTAPPSVAATTSPRPSATLTPSESPAPSPSGPALTERFVSDVHGISVSYPTGWSVQPATEPWTTNALPFFRERFGDFIYDPAYGDHLFIGIASQPLAGESTSHWAAPILAGHGCGSTDPITVDGAAGEVARDCLFAAVSRQERGYMIVLHVSDDDPELHDDYNLEWFEQVLGTVQLDPEAASSPPAVPGPLPTE